MAKNYLVSVAKAIMRDPTTGNLLAFGDANISSAFTLGMQNADVRGGIGNQLLYSYYHTRELSAKIEQANFGESIVAFNVGGTVSTGAVNVVHEECLQLSTSGSGTISLTPVGNVSVLLPDNSIQVVTPSTKDITVTGGNSALVTCVYVTSKSADQLTVSTTTPPSIVDLTLIAEIRASDQTTVVKYLNINIPRFQVAGNYTLNLAANGVSTESLEGKALASTATDCTNGEYYAKVTYIPVTSTTTYTSIAATPSTITWAKSTAQSSQITVLGIKGGVYQNTNITTSCSFVRSGSSGSGITVGATTGLISTSASATTIAETVTIGVNYATGSLIDYVVISIV